MVTQPALGSPTDRSTSPPPRRDGGRPSRHEPVAHHARTKTAARIPVGGHAHG